MNYFFKIFSTLFCFICLGACSDSDGTNKRPVKNQTSSLVQCEIETRNTSNNFQAQYLAFNVVAKYPREIAFTQGLQYQDGVLYESSGLRGKSFIAYGQYPPTQSAFAYRERGTLDAEFFAEGLTLHNNKLYQLTWTSEKAFVYDPSTLEVVEELSIGGQGWGITSDGASLYTSNGSSTITVRNDRLEELNEINVKMGARPLKQLNELEWVDGCLFANIWKNPTIAVINPDDGSVTALIDGSTLFKDQQAFYKRKPQGVALDVLNGIAYRKDTKALILTGKHWAHFYEIKLNH